MNENFINKEIDNFMARCCPWGFSDVKRAIEVITSVGLYSSDLFERIEEFCDDTQTKLINIDPVYIAYDYVLQEARNEIDNLIDFDIQNDIYIDIHANYMCTSLDFNEDDKIELIEQLKDVNNELIERCDFITWLLDEMDINISELSK